MSTISLPVGSRTSLTTSAMDSLASATYVSCGVITITTNDPLGLLVEAYATPGTVSGNKQVVIFARASLDGTNYTTGPVSGTTTTDETNLKFVGSIPCNTNSTLQRRIFDLTALWGGALPPYIEIVAKNDTGAALASSGHGVYYAEVLGSVA